MEKSKAYKILYIVLLLFAIVLLIVNLINYVKCGQAMIYLNKEYGGVDVCKACTMLKDSGTIKEVLSP